MSNYKMLAGFFFLLALVPGVGLGDDHRIVRVEEDWELDVTTPDPLLYSPQISTWMSPNDSLDDDYFCANFNHAQKADYPGGGIQTNAFKSNALMDERLNLTGVKLASNGEKIKWTQVMAVINQELVFAIKSGTSESWGDFGGPDSLVRFSTNRNHLNHYSPNKSAEWSGVGFASNRVASLRLTKVRYFTNQGQVFESNVNLQVQ